jgi:BirA family transcriptional regulator, biotin operon repressor / biotin---[acetyl-CoA-carboxylase] ligase
MQGDTMVAEQALSLDLICQNLAPQVVGRRICLYDAVPSTNAVLQELARRGSAEGTVVLAESQTAGRGRGGQPWFSPPGVNLYVSVLCRPDIEPGAAAVFSFMTSLALADAIREQGLAPAIKWPNDVLIERRKVAGTLAEAAVAGDRLEHVILGIGVNLNVEPEAMQTALGDAARHAISLREALGRQVDRNGFTAAFLTALDEWLITAREQGPAALLRAWHELDVVTGRRVEVRGEAGVFDGRARGVGTDGHLEVEDSRGVVHRVVAGEIRLLD